MQGLAIETNWHHSSEHVKLNMGIAHVIQLIIRSYRTIEDEMVYRMMLIFFYWGALCTMMLFVFILSDCIPLLFLLIIVVNYCFRSSASFLLHCCIIFLFSINPVSIDYKNKFIARRFKVCYISLSQFSLQY